MVNDAIRQLLFLRFLLLFRETSHYESYRFNSVETEPCSTCQKPHPSTRHDIIAIVFTRSVSHRKDRERPIVYHWPSNFSSISNLRSDCGYAEPFRYQLDCNCKLWVGTTRFPRHPTNHRTVCVPSSHRIISFLSGRYWKAERSKQCTEKAWKRVAFVRIIVEEDVNWALIASTRHLFVQSQHWHGYSSVDRFTSFQTALSHSNQQLQTRT